MAIMRPGMIPRPAQTQGQADGIGRRNGRLGRRGLKRIFVVLRTCLTASRVKRRLPAKRRPLLLFPLERQRYVSNVPSVCPTERLWRSPPLFRGALLRRAGHLARPSRLLAIHRRLPCQPGLQVFGVPQGMEKGNCYARQNPHVFPSTRARAPPLLYFRLPGLSDLRPSSTTAQPDFQRAQGEANGFTCC